MCILCAINCIPLEYTVQWVWGGVFTSDYFHHPQKICCELLYPFHPYQTTTDPLFVTIAWIYLPFVELRLNGIIQYILSVSGTFHSALWFWDSSVLWHRSEVLCHAESYFIMWIRFMCSLVEGHLGWFQFFAIVDKPAMNFTYQSLCGRVFVSL